MLTVETRSQVRAQNNCQSEKIHIELLSKVSSDFHNSILGKSDNKKRDFELIFEYIERGAKLFLELLGSWEIILSSERKRILVSVTERHELLHL